MVQARVCLAFFLAPKQINITNLLMNLHKSPLFTAAGLDTVINHACAFGDFGKLECALIPVEHSVSHIIMERLDTRGDFVILRKTIR